MRTLHRLALRSGSVLTVAAGLAFAAPGLLGVRSAASSGEDLQPDPLVEPAAAPWLRYELGPTTATHPLLGEVQLDAHEIWKPVCSSDTGSITFQEFERYVQRHKLLAAAPGAVVVDSGKDVPGGLNLVFVVSGSIPSGALAAIATAESYLEGVFSADPITVTVPMSFQVMSPGVLGGTGSSYGYLSWSGMRSLLVGGMDASDTLQSWLPSGTTFKVRYGSSSATTNEDRVFTTYANYKAHGGAVSGNDASMTFNSSFTWDFDPSNGVSTSNYSFVDVVIHETGHALGCTSGGDFRNKDLETMDLFRFQRTDGTGDFNPDTLAEFQARPRLVAYNAPNDDHNTDLIGVEYRMSDGSPYQMSHFREQSANIGLMDPALAPGETWYPAYFSSADVALFDAIGYDL